MSVEAAKMDPALLDKWLAALRSGEYEQTKGALRRDNSFCCLGVLCDVISPDGWQKNNDKDVGSSSYCYNFDEVNRNSAVIPRTPGVKLGLYELDEDAADACRISDMAMDMNDEGKTFPEIADYLESKLR
jgi:hypothetical protein